MKLQGSLLAMFAVSMLGPFFALAAISRPASAGTESVIYSFQNNGEDGYFPEAALTEASGALYGTTWNGGTGRCIDGCGTLFTVDPATGAETVLYSFRNRSAQSVQPGSPQILGSKLLGTTAAGGRRGEGSLFSYDLNSGALDTDYSFCSLFECGDGAAPVSGLIDWKGVLYGATSQGGIDGPYGHGVVFLFDPDTGTEAVIYAFCRRGGNCVDGSVPYGGLLRVKQKLYGTTVAGGTGGASCASCGTVFQIDATRGKHTVLYTFCSQQNCTDGVNPQGALIEWNGLLYGVTQSGGTGSCTQTFGCGTVFSIDPQSGAEKVVYAFQPTGGDAVEPQTGLVEMNGLFYGTTRNGGGKGEGAVYSVDPASGAETVLYSFCTLKNCADGEWPEAGLLNVNGTLYGTTYSGGTGTCPDKKFGCGTVFAITP